MALFLGLLSAVAFGGADFLGGLSTRRAPVMQVVLFVQIVGLGLALLLVLVATDPFPAGRDVALSAAGGTVGVTSLALFYRALASGRMGVVAPVAAVVTGLVPMTWGLAHGERPSSVALVGAAVAIIAVALVAREPDAAEALTRRLAEPVVLALLSGAGFGVTVTAFSEVGTDSGFWPLVFLRIPGTVAIALFLLRTRSLRFPRGAGVRNVVGGGILDLSGNAAIIQGFREGLTSIVAPVSALFPAATVILARVVLKEHLTRLQIGGLLIALVGLVLIGVGS